MALVAGAIELVHAVRTATQTGDFPTVVGVLYRSDAELDEPFIPLAGTRVCSPYGGRPWSPGRPTSRLIRGSAASVLWYVLSRIATASSLAEARDHAAEHYGISPHAVLNRKRSRNVRRIGGGRSWASAGFRAEAADE